MGCNFHDFSYSGTIVAFCGFNCLNNHTVYSFQFINKYSWFFIFVDLLRLRIWQKFLSRVIFPLYSNKYIVGTIHIWLQQIHGIRDIGVRDTEVQTVYQKHGVIGQ
jgi:hypothetical protein